MILCRVLSSTLSRHNRPHLSYFPNAVIQRPRGLRPSRLGAAALALSTAVGFVYLDSDTFRNEETTVGAVCPTFVVIFLAQLNPVQLNRPRPSNSQLLCEYHQRELFQNLRSSVWAWASCLS